jgi:hypothetical protein
MIENWSDSTVKGYQIEYSANRMVITIPGFVSKRMRDVMLLALPLWVILMGVLVDTLSRLLPALLSNGTVGRWFSFLFLAAFALFWVWHGYTLLRALMLRLGGKETVLLTPSEIEITRRVLWGVKQERFATSAVQQVNLAKVRQEALISSRSGRTIFSAPLNGPIRFQLPDRGVTVGLDLEQEDALHLISLIQAQLSQWDR